jgi:hypothetical protein
LNRERIMVSVRIYYRVFAEEDRQGNVKYLMRPASLLVSIGQNLRKKGHQDSSTAIGRQQRAGVIRGVS